MGAGRGGPFRWRMRGGHVCMFCGWMAVEIQQLIYEQKTVLKYENKSVFELDSAVLIWCLSRVF